MAHLTSCSVDVVDPSPALKQLLHEADHSPLFSADVTDQCSCNCAPPKCLHGVHRDIFTFFPCFGGMTPICMCNSVPQKISAKWSRGTVCVILQYCVVSKHNVAI